MTRVRERCCETKPGQIGVQFTAQPGGPLSVQFGAFFLTRACLTRSSWARPISTRCVKLARVKKDAPNWTGIGGPTQTIPGQTLPVMTLQTQLYNNNTLPQKCSYLTSNIALFDIEISVIWKLKMAFLFCKKTLS